MLSVVLYILGPQAHRLQAELQQRNDSPTMPSSKLPMVKMIVLEVDEPHPDDHKEKGSLGKILERHFIKAGQKHDPPLGVEVDQRFIVEDKGGKMPSIEDFEGVKGILITGSTYDAYGNDEWILKLIDLIKRKSIHLRLQH